jgi:hypothetical protein
MGFEYKIVASLTSKQQDEIKNLLQHHPLFDKKYLIGHVEYWDFRHFSNCEGIPDFTITFEDEGIYICKYAHSDLWTDLADLQRYLAANKIEATTYEE